MKMNPSDTLPPSMGRVKSMRKWVVMMLIAVLFCTMMPYQSFAANSPTLDNNYVSAPLEVTVAVGESVSVPVTVAEDSPYVYNIQWGQSPTCYAQMNTTGNYGSYWGQSSTCALTGLKPGTSRMYITCKAFTEAGVASSYVGNEKLTVNVTVVDQKETASEEEQKPAKTDEEQTTKQQTPSDEEQQDQEQQKPAAETVALTKIALNKASMSLTAGKSETLSVSYTPGNTTENKAVSWKSSNTAVATVSNGKVTAKKAGTATVTATCNGKTATCKVTVKDAAVALTKIALNKTSMSLTEGKSGTLSVSYTPSNTTVSKTVSWKSSNTAVATVSNGKVTAKKAGTATVTATCNGKTATCKVTVKKAAADTGSYKNVSDAYTCFNKFRTTKSNQWYWNSNNKTKTYTYGLKALKRDSSLEKVAQTRAKEAWIMYYEKGQATHTRPNGKGCFTAYPSGMTYRGENLAWGQTSATDVITGTYGWAETNQKYSGQGHRRNMLNGKFTKVGIACYTKDGKTCWAMCLGN